MVHHRLLDGCIESSVYHGTNLEERQYGLLDDRKGDIYDEYKVDEWDLYLEDADDGPFPPDAAYLFSVRWPYCCENTMVSAVCVLLTFFITEAIFHK